MAFRNQRLNKIEFTIDSSEEIWVKVQFLKGVNRFQTSGLFDLNCLEFLLLLLHANVVIKILLYIKELSGCLYSLRTLKIWQEGEEGNRDEWIGRELEYWVLRIGDGFRSMIG
jgi:hypothetical protein